VASATELVPGTHAFESPAFETPIREVVGERRGELDAAVTRLPMLGFVRDYERTLTAFSCGRRRRNDFEGALRDLVVARLPVVELVANDEL